MSSTANAPTMWRRLLVDDVRDVNVNARLVVEWGKIHVYANIKSEEEKKMMMLMDTKKKTESSSSFNGEKWNKNAFPPILEIEDELVMNRWASFSLKVS